MFYFYLSHIILLLSLCRVWKSKKTHKQLKEAQKESYEERKKELNMAVVLLWVVILFITCQSIKIIPDIYEVLYCTTKEVQFFTFISNLHFTIKHFKLFKFVISIIISYMKLIVILIDITMLLNIYKVFVGREFGVVMQVINMVLFISISFNS